MPSGHFMRDVARNERVLPYGVGCKRGGICFKCRLPECRNSGQGKLRAVIKDSDLVTWMNEAETSYCQTIKMVF